MNKLLNKSINGEGQRNIKLCQYPDLNKVQCSSALLRLPFLILSEKITATEKEGDNGPRREKKIKK